MSFSKVVIILSHVPVIAAAVYAGWIYKTLKAELKVFSFFLFLSGIIQLVSLILWFNRQNNLPLLHVYVAAGFVCLAWFYRIMLSDFINSRIIWTIALVFLGFTICNSLFIQKISTFNSYALTVECILVVTLSLSTYLLFLNLAAAGNSKENTRSLGWINTGLFIYYSSTLIIFYSGHVLMDRFPLFLNRYTWVLHSFFSVIMYICFFIGLWKRSAK